MNEQVQNIVEGEINLGELFAILMQNKRLIIAITMIITIMSALYIFFITKPIYEAKAVIEIGEYKLENNNNNNSNNNNNKVALDNASALQKKVSTIFIDMLENDDDKEYVISAINISKGLTNFLEIKAESHSNDSSIKGLNKVVSYIQKEHQSILDEVKQRRELELKNMDLIINDIKDKQVSLLDKKIELQKQNLLELEKQLKSIDENLKNIQSVNPTLAALKLMEKRDISNMIVNANLLVFDLESKKNELLTTSIYKLEENKKILETLLLPHNYKNTQIVGDIIINQHPIKPKKTLIIVVSFIMGFIFSIFFVFFKQFVQSEKDNKELIEHKKVCE